MPAGGQRQYHCSCQYKTNILQFHDMLYFFINPILYLKISEIARAHHPGHSIFICSLDDPFYHVLYTQCNLNVFLCLLYSGNIKIIRVTHRYAKFRQTRRQSKKLLCPYNGSPQGIQPFIDPLIPAVDLLNVMDDAGSRSTHGRDQQRHPGADIG